MGKRNKYKNANFITLASLRQKINVPQYQDCFSRSFELPITKGNMLNILEIK